MAVFHAAWCNQPEAVMTGLRHISHQTVRDQTASKAAILLADAGNRKAAVGVTTLISHQTVRDQTLRHIAAKP